MRSCFVCYLPPYVYDKLLRQLPILYAFQVLPMTPIPMLNEFCAFVPAPHTLANAHMSRVSIPEVLLRSGLNQYLTSCHGDHVRDVLTVPGCAVIMSPSSCCPTEQSVASSSEDCVFGFVY